MCRSVCFFFTARDRKKSGRRENVDNLKGKPPETQSGIEFQGVSGARDLNQSAVRIKLLCGVFTGISQHSGDGLKINSV